MVGDGHRERGRGLGSQVLPAAQPQQGDVGPKCPTLSLHTPSDLPSPIAGARIEGRRQNTPGDPAPKSSPGGAGVKEGGVWLWRNRGVHRVSRMQTSRHPWIIRSLPTLDSTPGNDQRPRQRGRTHSSSRSPHRVPSWLSPASPPPTESGLGTRLCYEHKVDELHGRSGKLESLSPQTALVPLRPAIKRKAKINLPAKN